MCSLQLCFFCFCFFTGRPRCAWIHGFCAQFWCILIGTFWSPEIFFVSFWVLLCHSLEYAILPNNGLVWFCGYPLEISHICLYSLLAELAFLLCFLVLKLSGLCYVFCSIACGGPIVSQFIQPCRWTACFESCWFQTLVAMSPVSVACWSCL
jgi:hypothetical protein